MKKKQALAPVGPCVDGGPHAFWLVVGYDDQHNYGSHGTCQRCGAERFYPVPRADEGFRLGIRPKAAS